MSANNWLRAQRKSDLVGLAEYVKLSDIDGLKKTDLEIALDQHLSEHAIYASDAKLAPYYISRSKSSISSPVKKEAPELKVSRRRQTSKSAIQESPEPTEDEDIVRATSTAVARTPARALQLASRIPLPASPADVANAVDRGTVAVRERVASIYADSGITEATQATRESLSSVTAVLFLINAFELYYLRPKLLDNRYAFTIPAVSALGTPDYPVYVPDIFLLLTSHFWSPALTWAFTSIILPSLAGYFVNLSAAQHTSSRGRPRHHSPEYPVDPLTFSVTKAVLTYVVYSMGASFGGWIDQESVATINSALFGSWQGAVVGSAVTGLMSVYEAVLKK